MLGAHCKMVMVSKKYNHQWLLKSLSLIAITPKRRRMRSYSRTFRTIITYWSSSFSSTLTAHYHQWTALQIQTFFCQIYQLKTSRKISKKSRSQNSRRTSSKSLSSEAKSSSIPLQLPKTRRNMSTTSTISSLIVSRCSSTTHTLKVANKPNPAR